MGDVFNEKDVKQISYELEKRSNVPNHVFDVINNLPKDMHPMTQFSIAILSLQNGSNFSVSYKRGLNKLDYCLCLI